jgi:DNA end-binding protein Ku
LSIPQSRRFPRSGGGNTNGVVPRAIWTGAIAFGLVNVPVRMYSAAAEHDVHFHLVHEPDGSRIGYEKICKVEDKPVPDDEIVKAYEVEKDEYVHMSDEDFRAAQAETYRTIDVRDFVPYEEIDPIYFERTYYLGPEQGSERVYALLRTAMEDSELAGVATFVMRDRQQLGLLRVRSGVLTLERMHFADEIRPVDEIAPGNVKVDKRELDLARELIDRFSGSFDPSRYEDTYQQRLLEVIEQKRSGKEVRAAPEPEREEPPDLMDALRASLESAKRDGGRRADGDGELEELSKEELLELAKEADISGRSRMSKRELVRALEKA